MFNHGIDVTKRVELKILETVMLWKLRDRNSTLWRHGGGVWNNDLFLTIVRNPNCC